ncbi:hypothetical protein [Actinocorallia longicatena]|uniref:Uncharacterized protein n=1 Tax=Actinocorallia longicatena TaxID=111803 RepID=A0ABP6Q752_9ACTN
MSLLRGTAALVALLLIAGPVPAAARDGAGASAAPADAAPGTVVRVHGVGWPAGISVQISVCGRMGVNGSADCDASGAVTVPVAPDGTLDAGLSVTAPPVPCPCVLHLTTPPGVPEQTLNLPFEVLGHPQAAVVKQAEPVRVDLIDAELTGGGTWSELLGWRTRRTLVLTVRNSGGQKVVNAPLVVGWGAGGEADSPVTAPPTGTVEPGRTAVFRVPVELPPASYGTFVVGGRFAGQVPFETSFSTYPYGLFGVNLAALVLLVLGVRAAIRRRRRPPAAPAAAVAPALSEPLDRSALLGYLESTAGRVDGDTLVIDRPALVAYLKGPRLVDPEALDRFLAGRSPDGPRELGSGR